jgi:hypothetical protein
MTDRATGSFTLHVIETSLASGVPDSGGVPGEKLELQSALSSLFRRDKDVSSEKILTSWRDTNKALMIMIEDTQKDEQNKGMRLDELEVSLSVSGEGNVGFVSAKAEAGIVLKFKRV